MSRPLASRLKESLDRLRLSGLHRPFEQPSQIVSAFEDRGDEVGTLQIGAAPVAEQPRQRVVDAGDRTVACALAEAVRGTLELPPVLLLTLIEPQLQHGQPLDVTTKRRRMRAHGVELPAQPIGLLLDPRGVAGTGFDREPAALLDLQEGILQRDGQGPLLAELLLERHAGADLLVEPSLERGGPRG